MGLELSRQSPAWVRKGKISEMQLPISQGKRREWVTASAAGEKEVRKSLKRAAGFGTREP